MGKILILALFAAGAGVAQDSRPAKPEKPASSPVGRHEKPASAPVTRPFETTLLGRKVTLAIPQDWKETSEPSTFSLEEWKTAKGWAHPTIKGCAVHLFGVEGKDLTPATLARKWIDAAGTAKVDLRIDATGKNRQVRGVDLEVDLNENGAISYYWMRAIAASKDRVLVLLGEVVPVDPRSIGGAVEPIGRILDSVMDPSRKDPWRRDAPITIAHEKLVTKIAPPAGWTYSRNGAHDFVWTGPIEGQSIALSFPQSSFSAVTQTGQKLEIPPEQIYKLMVDIHERMAGKGGKLISKTAIPGHDQATEIVDAQDPGEEEESGWWTRRRIMLDAGTLVMLTAEHPVANASTPPPDAFQKLMTSTMDSLKLEVEKPGGK